MGAEVNPTVAALTEICRIVAAVCQARGLDAARLGAIVASLRDNGADALADCIVGVVPFELSVAEMERLTDG